MGGIKQTISTHDAEKYKKRRNVSAPDEAGDLSYQENLGGSQSVVFPVTIICSSSWSAVWLYDMVLVNERWSLCKLFTTSSVGHFSCQPEVIHHSIITFPIIALSVYC